MNEQKPTQNEWILNATYFVFVLIAVFSITYGILYFFRLVPTELGGRERITNFEYASEYWLGGYEINRVNEEVATRPERIIINKAKVDTVIGQPDTQDVNVLDQYLNRGAVHYPGSGTVERGNMFIFGHSSGLSTVRNPAYQAFNGIENLTFGDEIIIEAGGRRYIYKVTKVKLLNEDEALITFDNTKRTLTLSTCNTFGRKQERWIVEAEFNRGI